MPSPTRDDAIRAALGAADDAGIPRLLMLALGIAESNLNPLAERWGSAQNTPSAKEALAAGDLQRLAEIREQAGNDVSFGAWQQTWRWSAEFDGTQEIAKILAMREKYFDPTHAAAVAAARIAPYWHRYGDPLEALCRYNKPAVPSEENPNRPNCQRGLNEAEALLATLPDNFSVPGSHGGVAMDQALNILWIAANPNVTLNPNAGIYKYWAIKEHRERLGSPLSGEVTDPNDGMPYQAFTSNIIVRWTPGGAEEV